MSKINVLNTEISVQNVNGEDYISLTDMAGCKKSASRAADVIKNWIRTRFSIEFLGTWEIIHNPNFKVVEFDHFKMQAGLPNFVMSVSDWIESTNAIGLIVRKGKYGGTYAQKDIAFEFGTAISVQFKLYLIDEFQRLKAAEQAQLGWSVKRELSKINYFKPSAATKFTWALSRRKVKRYEVAPLPYPHRRCQAELDSCDAHSTRNFLRICQ